MSDYARANTGGATHFGDKDALTTGDSNKVIVGAQFDTEFNAIVTASASKYDSDDLASAAEAQAETLNTKLITPLRLSSWSEANDAVIADLHALASQAADSLYGWDSSASAAIGFTLGDGLEFSGTTVRLEHLGIGDLEDPNDDRIMFWDDTAGSMQWLDIGGGLEISGVTLSIANSLAGAGLTESANVMAVGAGNGITVNADDVALTDAAASTTNPIDISTGTISFDPSSLTTLNGNAVAATDRFVVYDASATAMKAIRLQDAGLTVATEVTSTANKTFTDAEMNQVWVYNGAAAVNWDIDTGAGIAGNFLVIVQQSAAANQVDLSGGTATLNEPDGLLKTRTQDSVIIALCTAANVWYVYGDTGA
jgi:hypothetical protein